MNRTNPVVLFGFLLAIIMAMSGAALMKGGLYVAKHEYDTFHALEIVFRMAEGQWPHLDFMTPIGAFAFAPIALFMQLGYGVGSSFLLAQAFVSVLFLPGIWWAAYSRYSGVLPYVFGLIVLVLITALVHGESQRSISTSMHYNRWAWAAAFVAISIAILPNTGKKHPALDGLVIGVAMSALLMLKMTYFVTFLAPVIVALILRKNSLALLVSIIVGIVIVAAIASIAGLNYWLSYLSDLLVVVSSEVRTAPTNAFGAVLGAPAYIAGSLILMFSVVLLRQSEETVGGLVLLLLVPGFFYVTYQNWGNDPQWLLLLAVLLLAMQPPAGIVNGLGWDMREAVRIAAAVAFALAAPSFFNLAYSPFRHLTSDVSEYVPILPSFGRDADLYAGIQRTIRVTAKIPLDGPGTAYASFADIGELVEPTTFRGETLPQCELGFGMTAWFQTIVDDLNAAGLAEGKRVFAADLFSSHWLFGPLLPLKSGAPWYYGGLPGFDSADYFIVPLCPVARRVQAQILEAVDESGVTLTEVRRTPLYILYLKDADNG